VIKYINMDKSSEKPYIPLADIIPTSGEVDEYSEPLVVEYAGVQRMLRHINVGQPVRDSRNNRDSLDWVRSTSIRYPEAMVDSHYIPSMLKELELAQANPNATTSLRTLHYFGYAALSMIHNNQYLQQGTVFERSEDLSRIHYTMRLQKSSYDATLLTLSNNEFRIVDTEDARNQADVENFDQSLAVAIAMTARETMPQLETFTRWGRSFIYGAAIGHSNLQYDENSYVSLHKKAVRNRLQHNAGTSKTLNDRIRVLQTALGDDVKLLDSIKRTTGYDEDSLQMAIADAYATLREHENEKSKQLRAQVKAQANSAFLHKGVIGGYTTNFEEERIKNSEVLPWDTYREVVRTAITSNGDFIPLPYANPSLSIVKKDDIPSLVRGSVSALGVDMIQSVPNLDITQPISFADFKADRIVNLSNALLNKYNGTVSDLEIRVLPISEEHYSSLGLKDVRPESLACLTIRAQLKNNRTSEVTTYVYYAKSEDTNNESGTTSSRLVATVRKNELTAAAAFTREYLEKSKSTGRAVEARAITHPLRGGLVNGSR
jgi:hypothetical protein